MSEEKQNPNWKEFNEILENELRKKQVKTVRKSVLKIEDELWSKLFKLYYLRNSNDREIAEVIQVIIDFVHNHNYLVNSQQFKELINEAKCYFYCDDLCDTQEERNCKDLVVHYLITLVTKPVILGNDLMSLEIEDRDLLKKYDAMRDNTDRFKSLYFYKKTDDEISGKRVLHQMLYEMYGWKYDDDDNLVIEPEKQSKKDLGTDKRIKYRDIQMIDADTKEVVHVFSSREECINATGITKSYLSQCITSCKDTNGGWKRWHDKDNDKYYYFKEKYKD